ncbi:MAG TPA: hypothetical protein VHA78_00700 [Candidatus Peribacteraceae bacterium]|nr:hypothetical protein [Candidatus Peribacteraceae bacterium]
MKNFEHMTLDQLAEEGRRITQELAALPEDTAWGGEGHSNEQYDRFTFSDEDETDARRANEDVAEQRRNLEREQNAVKELIRKRIEVERTARKQQALDVTKVEAEVDKEDSDYYVDHGHGTAEEFGW